MELLGAGLNCFERYPPQLQGYSMIYAPAWPLLAEILLIILIMASISSNSTLAAAAASDTSQTSSSSTVLERSEPIEQQQQTQEEEQQQQQQQQQLDSQTIQAYEGLNKWKDCSRPDAPARLVYQHNRSRAAATGFPTRLQIGKGLGLTDHETAALFGWTTGDYRLVNPIARGLPSVEFEDYPFLPQELVKVTCRLSRFDVMPYVRVLRSALSKLPPLNTRQRLWRGHKRKLPSAKVGSRIEMTGFTSVTRDRENAIDFAAKSNEGRSAHRTVLAILDHSSGRCISKLSARPGEMEVLFPPNAVFEVVDPPGDTGENDMRAVQKAAERMRKSVPGAEIDLVYVREISSDGKRGEEEDARPPVRIIREDL